MSQEFEDELSTEERQAFAGLVREQTPPPALEERVVEALKQAKLLRPRKRLWRARVPRVGLAVAASLLIFMFGAVVGGKWLAKPAQKTDAPAFMLLLRAVPERAQPRSAEELRQRVKEYSDWAGQLRQQGVRVDGERLGTEARVLSMSDGRAVVSENRSALEQPVVSGYFLIAARDYESAAKVAAGCPHLKYGGSIEVRQIARF
jgi:hypothetical protein